MIKNLYNIPRTGKKVGNNYIYINKGILGKFFRVSIMVNNNEYKRYILNLQDRYDRKELLHRKKNVLSYEKTIIDESNPELKAELEILCKPDVNEFVLSVELDQKTLDTIIDRWDVNKPIGLINAIINLNSICRQFVDIELRYELNQLLSLIQEKNTSR